jgi:pyruvate-formate lyase-activating enzyme
MRQNKIYLKARNLAKKVYHTIKKPKATAFPEIMSIELTTICNANCKFCPHSQIMARDEARKWNMPESVFKKIIDESVGHPELKLIKPSLFGEPALTPHLLERLKYIRLNLPNVKIRLITNGSKFNWQLTDAIFKEHLCDEINFSLDANDKETFETFKGISWDETIENLEYFIDKNKRAKRQIKIILSFVYTPENEDQLNGFKVRWREKVDEINVGAESGLRRRKNYIPKRTKLPCSQLFNRINFLTDGRAVMCCLDAFCEVPIGDVKKESVSDIWNGEKLKKLQALHLKGRKNNIPLCKICEEWY